MRGLLSSFNTREKSITLKWEGQWLLSWGSFSFFLLREHDLFVQFVLLTFKIAAHALQRLTAVALPGAGGVPTINLSIQPDYESAVTKLHANTF